MTNLPFLTVLMLIRKGMFGWQIEVIIVFRNLILKEIFSWPLALREKGESEFRQLRHVGVDDQLQYVYAVDSANHRIQKFDINGNFIEKLLGN